MIRSAAAGPHHAPARTGFATLPRWAACRMTRRMLYEVESGDVGMPTVLDRHRRECLACQAASVHQRHLIRGLASLRGLLEPIPYDMAAVFDHPAPVASERYGRTRPLRPASAPVRAAVASAASLAALGVVVAAGRWIRSHAG